MSEASLDGLEQLFEVDVLGDGVLFVFNSFKHDLHTKSCGFSISRLKSLKHLGQHRVLRPRQSAHHTENNLAGDVFEVAISQVNFLKQVVVACKSYVLNTRRKLNKRVKTLKSFESIRQVGIFYHLLQARSKLLK